MISGVEVLQDVQYPLALVSCFSICSMTVVLCPGFHEPGLTEDFISALLAATGSSTPALDIWIYPASRFPAYSGLHVLRFLQERLQVSQASSDRFPVRSWLFIGFSAGVVAAMTAALAWAAQGQQVKALLAMDGWGVPLFGPFPIHRLSHDAFTHWSSAWLGAGNDSFYATPAVEHLNLWRLPHQAVGVGITATPPGRYRITAVDFIVQLLRRYDELPKTQVY